MTALAPRQRCIFLRSHIRMDPALNAPLFKGSVPVLKTMRLDGQACVSRRRWRAMEEPRERGWPCVDAPRNADSWRSNMRESGMWVDRPSWTGCHPARPHSVTDPSACLAARSPLMEAPLNSRPHRAVMGLRPEPRPVITPTGLRASVGHATGRFYEICLKSRKTCRAGKVKAGTPSACIGHDLGMISHDR